MVKYIRCGKYINYYKYIGLATLFSVICSILFGSGLCAGTNSIYIARFFPDETKEIQIALSHHIIIHNIYRNLGILIISIILYNYEQNSLKSKKKEESLEKMGSSFELIYEDVIEEPEPIKISIFLVLLVIVLFNIQDILTLFYYQFDLEDLNFWTLEFPFFAYFNYKILNIKLYRHHKFAIYLNVIICLIAKIIEMFVYSNSDVYKNEIYNQHKFLYFIGVFSFLIIIFIRAYSVTKIKEFIDLRYFSPTRILIINGSIGIVINIIIMLIFSFSKCATVDNIDIHLCNVVDNNDRDEAYLENFLIYFRILHDSIDKGRYYEVIIEVFTSFFGLLSYMCFIYYYILLIKYLTPVHTIFYNIINSFCVLMLGFFFSLIIKSDNNQTPNNFILSILGLITLFFNTFAGCIYCEMIELHFCNLQHDLRRNIIKRSEDELKFNQNSKSINALLENEDDDDDSIRYSFNNNMNYIELKDKK